MGEGHGPCPVPTLQVCSLAPSPSRNQTLLPPPPPPPQGACSLPWALSPKAVCELCKPGCQFVPSQQSKQHGVGATCTLWDVSKAGYPSSPPSEELLGAITDTDHRPLF